MIVVAAAAYGGWNLVKAPFFTMHEFDVEGLARVSRADVVAQAAIDPHANVWLLDKRAIETRVESIPYVLSARVHRIPLAKVRIDVVERARDGCALGPYGDAVTIDADRRVLETGCADASLPKYLLAHTPSPKAGTFLTDSTLAELQSDAHALATLGEHYARFSFDGFGDLEAMLPGGIRVRFGDDDDLPRKERLVGPILAQLGPRAAEVASVDLRAPATPVVEFRGPGK